MNQIQRQVKEFMVAAGQQCPHKPAIPDEKTRVLRVRLLLEEVLEFAEASGVKISVPFALPDITAKVQADPVDFFNGSVELSGLECVDFKAEAVQDQLGIPDALADINYVSYGAAVAYGLDMEPFEAEVHSSNMSKFIDGYRDEATGKWIKGPSYRPVNFKPILDAQINE